MSAVLPSIPSFQAAGTSVNGTGNLSPAWPTHQANDVALLVVVSQNEANVLGTASGFVEVTSSPQNQAGTVPARLSVFWCRATTSSQAAPTVTATTLNRYARIYTFRNCANSGNPWDVIGAGTNATGTAVSVATTTTTQQQELICAIVGYEALSASGQASSPANASLGSVTLRGDESTLLGGGAALITGTLAAGGATGATTATLGTSSSYACLSIALKPQWTVDPASSKCFPANSQEWTDFITGAGLSCAVPDMLHLMQEASGNAADSIGSFTLTAAATLAYQQAEAGFTRKTISFTDASNTSNLTTTSVSLPDTSTGSLTYTIIANMTATPSAVHDFMAIGTSGIRAQIVNTTPRSRIAAGSTVSGTVSPTATVQPYTVKSDATNAATVLYTGQEILKPTRGSPTGKALQIGGSSSFLASTAMRVMYGFGWINSNAELSDGKIVDVYEAMGFARPSAAFAITMNESTSISDANTRVFGAQRALAESITGIAESNTGTKMKLVLVTETTSISDAATRTATYARVPAETTSISDAVIRLVSIARTIADAVTGISDAVARVAGYSRAPAETTSISDANTRTLGAHRAPVETTSISDANTRTLGAHRAPAETTSISDASTRAFSAHRAPVETTSISDASTRAFSAQRTPAETTSISDAVVRFVSAARALAETTSISDANTRTFSAHRAPAETTVILDAVTRVASVARALTESIVGVADSVARAVSTSRAVAVTITGISDALAQRVAYVRIPLETTSTSDSIARHASTSRGQSESVVGIADTWHLTAAFARAVSETVAGISDTARGRVRRSGTLSGILRVVHQLTGSMVVKNFLTGTLVRR